MHHQLDLHAEPDAVPRARRFVLTALDDAAADALADDLALIVTELCTNAVLHAGPPIVVRVVELSADRVRVEVEDPNPHLPVLPQQSAEAMTGRGLALVGALASSWGVEPTPTGGKVVWAEVSTTDRSEHAPAPFQIDVDVLDAWSEDDGQLERATPVRVVDVPTDLLVETERTVDNLAREFALSAGSTGAGREQLPAHLLDLVGSVSRGFRARADVKRQAAEAAARGEARCDLDLELRPSSLGEAERYLAALDEADEYARAARLLTLESPPAQRVLRRWYVEEMVAQLRAQAGGPAYEPTTFEQRLLREVTGLSSAQRAFERVARLQSVTAPLGAAETEEQVAEVLVREGMGALGAARAAVLAPRGAQVSVLAAVGFPREVLDRWEAAGPDESFPYGVVLRTGQPVWLESQQERDERFPLLSDLEPFTVAACGVPMTSGGQVLAALRLSFDRPRLFDAEERQFVLALAGQAAQALHRSRAYDAEREARGEAERLADHLADTANRLTRLQRITADLTAARDPQEVARVVVDSAASAFGALNAVLYRLGDDEALHAVEIAGSAGSLAGWTDLDLATDAPVCEAVRTGQPVVVSDSAELQRRYTAFRDVAVQDRAVLVAPLSLGERRLGCLALIFPATQLVDRQAQLRFLVAMADASAQALERATATSRAADAATRLAFLAEASVELSGSVDYRETLAAVARLVVPRLADWCSVDLLEDGGIRPVAVAHSDPAKVAWARELRERYPVEPDAPTGVAQVIRTGKSELHPTIPEELLVASAPTEEQLRILRQVGLSSVLIVPLTGRSGTFGALQMIMAESGRHYGPDDLAFAEDLARRVALAVETAHAFREQSGRLEAVTRVAEAAQRAILAPVPDRVGPVALAAAYVSAVTEARIGGDLYEVVPRPGGLRLLIGDVRGKGLDAVRRATVVLGEFRAAAADRGDLVAVATQVDRRLPAWFGEEDFVTALLAEISDDGAVEVVACGHPPALLVTGGRLQPVGAQDSLPLGLGATPTASRARMRPGDRLLLYTEALLGGRGGDPTAVDVADLSAPVADGALGTVLDRLLARVTGPDGTGLADDLALLLAEYAPPSPHATPTGAP